MPIITKIIRAKYEIPNTELNKIDEIKERMMTSFQEMRLGKETETIVK